MRESFRYAAIALAWVCCSGAGIPANLHVTLTDRALTFDHDGHVLSTAVVCPGYVFDSFGPTGPQFSPDNHWLLVDVKGPFTPGNVPRTHALVRVATGDIVLAPNFPAYLGIPTSLEPMAWASGRRSTVAYGDGKSATLEEPHRAIPPQRCSAGASGGAVATPAPDSSATPFPF